MSDTWNSEDDARPRRALASDPQPGSQPDSGPAPSQPTDPWATSWPPPAPTHDDTWDARPTALPGTPPPPPPAWTPGAPLPALPAVVNDEPLPVVPRQYHEFFRVPRWRWWRGLLMLLVGGIGWFIGNLVLSGAAIGYDIATGDKPWQQYFEELQKGTLTPALFFANNLSLATFILVAGLMAWAFLGQRPRWMSSVAGGLRWRWLGTVAAVIVPIYLLFMGISFALDRSQFDGLSWRSTSLFMIIAILLTTPLQAAGEEYGFRGLLTRVVGGWVPGRTAGLIAGLVVSSLAFMFMHGAADPWLNVFYFLFGAIACVLTWRTGGLEAAIVMHVTNNLLFEATMPFSSMEGAFDRSAGQGDPSILIISAMQLVILVLVELLARRSKVLRETAPGAPPAVPVGMQATPPATAPGTPQAPFGPGTAPFGHQHGTGEG